MDAKAPTRKTTKTGTVIAKTMRKTVKVQVERQIRHPRYKKPIRQRRTFLVHDETEACRVGDVVRIVETRPISRLKRWRILEIVVAPTSPKVMTTAADGGSK
jgi:small subunit ribosomal protein S17